MTAPLVAESLYRFFHAGDDEALALQGVSLTVEAGERLSRRPEAVRAAKRARGIGMVYQQANLVGHLGVADNVALAQRLVGNADGPRRDALLRDRARSGAAVLVVTHDPDVAGATDRRIHLVDGRHV